MKELNKDEILDWFERFKSILTLGGIWNRRSEQIYRQVRQLIENQPEVDVIFIDKWVASIFLSLEHYIQENDINEANNQLEIHLRELLQEAGVRIKENEKS